MHASLIMSQPAIVVREDATLQEAARLMLERRIGGLPVVDADGKLVGIVTQSDFAFRESRVPFTMLVEPQLFKEFLGPEGVERAFAVAHEKRVKDVMTTPVVTIAEDTPLDEMLKTMLEAKVTRLPVVRDERVVGIVSRHDLLRIVAKGP